MDDANFLPNDLAECHQLLLAAFKQSTELERVLDETAASHEELKEKHQTTVDELDALMAEVGGDRVRFLKLMNVEKLADICNFALAKTALKSKRGARK